MFAFKTVASMAIALASLGQAHLVMDSPVPFGKDSLDNSPLVDAKPGTGQSDYPCKQRAGVYDITEMNKMKVGEDQKLSFSGSASHGGGTCQVAVSMDREPTADSVFKIIQVFEGGCPVASTGNTGTDTFSFQIPEGFPNGVSTLAWTWFNKIGNREMYMNCAPIDVSGGSDDMDYYDSLPNMYVVNMPTTECQSESGSAVSIPNPGQFVLKHEEGQQIKPASGSSCEAAAAAQTEGVGGYKGPSGGSGGDGGSSGGSTSGGSPTESGAPASSSSSSSSDSDGSGGGYDDGSYHGIGSSGGSDSSDSSSSGGSESADAPASSAAPPAPSQPVASPPPSAPSSSDPETPSPSAEPATPDIGSGPESSTGSDSDSSSPNSDSGTDSSNSSSGSAPPAPGDACSSSGLSCSPDGAQFGLCDNGAVVWQAVADGTRCEGGGIVEKREEDVVGMGVAAHVRRHAGKHVGRRGRVLR